MASETDSLISAVSIPANPSASAMSGSLAREIPVTATGARPGTNASNRALFNEETTSVLISEKGAVIRLNSAVVIGQLVFITNNESHREVVAQVVRVRAFRPTSCYVEMEFTEPAPDFWGVDFNTEAAQPPKDPKQRETIAAVRAAKPANTESLARAATPTIEEVSALKDEVTALREQLKLLQSQASTAQAPVPPREPDFYLPDPPPLIPPGSPMEVSHPAPVPSFEFNTNSASDKPSASALPPPTPSLGLSAPKPSAVPTTGPQPPAQASSLPLDRDVPPAQPQFYVPQPASSIEHSVATDVASSQPLAAPDAAPRTNFPRVAPFSSRKSMKARGSFTPGVQTLLRRVLVPAVTVLAVLGVFAWRAPIILSLITGKSAPTAASASSKSAPKPVPASPKAPLPEGLTPPFAAPRSIPGDKGQVAVVSPDASGKTGDRFLDASVVTKSSARNGARARGPRINPTQVTISDLSPVAMDDPTVVPPQLIKSVKAVAPPDALRRFFTGNVSVQAVVDAAGRVTSAKAVAGPPSLYQAAVDTLKEYRFAPATRNGKAVPAHVELTINFWFEP